MISGESPAQAAQIPPAYALQAGQSLPLDQGLSLLRDDDCFVYFLFTQPVASHAIDDKVSRNQCLARCALHGLAEPAALAQAFGLNPRTVRRAKARLQERGEGAYVQPRKPRRRHAIVDPELLDKASARLQAGQSLYRVAKDLGLNCSTLWRYSREGLLPTSQCPPRRAADNTPASPSEALQTPATESAESVVPTSGAVDLVGKAERNRRAAQAVLGRAAHDTEGRVAASLGLLDGRSPEFAPAEAVSGAGVLTALPALLEQGLLRHLERLSLPKGYYALPSLLLLWAFLLLGRVRHAEGLRYQQPGEWGALLGLDRCPCPRCCFPQ